MRRVSLFAGVMLPVLLAAFVTTIGASADRKASSAAAVTGEIRYAGSLTSQLGIDRIIAHFEKKYPGVKVKPEYYSPANIDAVLRTQFQSGNAPDVVALAGGALYEPSTETYQKAGYLVDLSKEPWAKRVPKWARTSVTVGKSVYGWPGRIGLSVLIYNRGLFRTLGVKAPRTFSQLLSVCRAIKAKTSILPMALAMGSLQSAGGFAQVIAAETVYGKDPNWNTKRARGQVTFANTPGWRTVFERVAALRQDCIGPEAVGLQPNDTTARVVAGRAAMMSNADANIAVAKALNPKLDLGMVPQPGQTIDKTYVNVLPTTMMAINKSSKNVAAAKAFINYVSTPNVGALLSSTLNEVSPLAVQRATDPKIGRAALPATHKVFGPYVKRMAVSGGTTWPTPAVSSALGTGVQGIITGQRTINEALQAADAAWPK